MQLLECLHIIFKVQAQALFLQPSIFGQADLLEKWPELVPAIMVNLQSNEKCALRAYSLHSAAACSSRINGAMAALRMVYKTYQYALTAWLAFPAVVLRFKDNSRDALEFIVEQRSVHACMH